MEAFDVDSLSYVLAQLFSLENLLEMRRRQIGDIKITPEIRTAVSPFISEAQKDLSGVKLATCRPLVAQCLARVAVDDNTLGMMLSEARHAKDLIVDELKKWKFVGIDPDHAKAFEQEHLFGPDVTKAFPSASFDIREAGSCLAVGADTAAVFHLMRAVEWALRALCVHVGLRTLRGKIKKSGAKAYVPIEYSEWEKILDQLQVRIDDRLQRTKRGARKQRLQECYYPALQDIRAIRDAWRNHVMHTRAVQFF
jgi:hypothetical protein